MTRVDSFPIQQLPHLAGGCSNIVPALASISVTSSGRVAGRPIRTETVHCSTAAQTVQRRSDSTSSKKTRSSRSQSLKRRVAGGAVQIYVDDCGWAAAGRALMDAFSGSQYERRSPFLERNKGCGRPGPVGDRCCVMTARQLGRYIRLAPCECCQPLSFSPMSMFLVPLIPPRSDLLLTSPVSYPHERCAFSSISRRKFALGGQGGRSTRHGGRKKGQDSFLPLRPFEIRTPLLLMYCPLYPSYCNDLLLAHKGVKDRRVCVRIRQVAPASCV